MHLGQPVWNLLNALFFEYGIAAYDLELRGQLRRGKQHTEKFRREAAAVLRKLRKQVAKVYLVHPGFSMVTGSFIPTALANFTANTVRNVWSHSVIMCGHFPEGVETFETRSIEGETKPQWYLRQMLGSANISGPKLMHIMTGNLSHQIEHHLFPDLPSNRYGEIAPKVKALFERYDLAYCARPLPQQVYSAWHKVVRLSLPNGWLDTTNLRNLPSQVKRLYEMTSGGPKVRRALQARLLQEHRRALAAAA
jgi:linoleoyl-CoA desaturase